MITRPSQLVLLVLAAVANAALRGAEPPASKALAPDQAVRSFELHEDYRIELVASEPLVQDPVAMAFDEQGALFVVEYPEFNHYQFPDEAKRQGRVKRLVDTDHDGTFDEATVFVEVPFATAVLCYDGGVFVGAPPDLLFCRDTDGDGRADERNIMLTGFGRDFAGGGLMNSLRWGIDNRIHIATGFAGGRVRRPDWEPSRAIDIRRRGLTFDPRTLDVQPTSGGGQHGMSMDDWGNKFLCSNVYPLQLLMYDDRYAERNPFFSPPAPAIEINGEGPLAKLHRLSPLEPWRVHRSKLVAQQRNDEEGSRPGGVFTSASGITVYRGDAFPQSFYGNLFVGEVANNLVYRARLEQRGLEQVALRADKEGEFLASRDPWFRPVQFGGGPDGALYIVDMYRELIEGAAFVPRESLDKLDPSRGTDLGRIYRVVPKDHQPREAVNFAEASVEELVELLSHPNGWHRDTAARLLYERDDPEAIQPLKQVARKAVDPRARVLALYGLRSHEALDEELLIGTLQEPHTQVRVHALRLAETELDQSGLLLGLAYTGVTHHDVRVRYQAAFTLGYVEGPRWNDSLAALALGDIDNRWMRMAVRTSLKTGTGDVFARLATNPGASKPPLREFLLALAAQVGVQSSSREVAAVLRALRDLESGDRELAVVAKRQLLSKLNRSQLGDVDIAASVSTLYEEVVSTARVVAIDEKAAIDKRVDAVSTLHLADFSKDETRQLFERLLDAKQPTAVRAAACRALANVDHDEVGVLLVDAWPTMTPAVRREALETLLTRTKSIDRLLDAIEANRVSASVLDRSRLKLLSDAVPAETAARLAKLSAAATEDNRQSVIAAYRSSLALEGDAVRGKAVFQRACASCHQRGSLGKAVGPSLNDASRQPPEPLLVEILAPNRRLKPLFQNYLLTMRDGRLLTGMIAEETATGLRLAQADDRATDILRADIESLRATGVSFMPEGLEKTIDRQAMADLLTFLRDSDR